jgi:crotonobetainyl-CoA:carnitine CoA-transferase CaiB-like acyl-CoA transferase
MHRQRSCISKLDALDGSRARRMRENPGPLAGVRIVGSEHSVAGPLRTRIFGDTGAGVIKVESEGNRRG